MLHLLKTALVAFTQLKSSAPADLSPANDELVPTPGSISSTMSVKSLNHILSLAAPLAANEILNGKTFDVGMDKKGFLNFYEVEVGSVKCNSVDGPKK